MNSALRDLMELLDSPRLRRLRDPEGVVSFRLFIMGWADPLPSRSATDEQRSLMTAPTPPRGVPVLGAATASAPSSPHQRDRSRDKHHDEA